MRHCRAYSTGHTFDDVLEFVLGDYPTCVDNLETRLGGETFMGISRSANPEWLGWIVLDRRRGGAGWDGGGAGFDTPADMRGLVRSFYKDHYWRPVYADTMPAPLAVAVFDSAVVHGRNRALRFLQEALNNVHGFRKLEVDGIFRLDSRQALGALVARDEWYVRTLALETLRIRQGHCDHIACGDLQARSLCRARILGVRQLFERSGGAVDVMPAEAAGMGFAG